MTGSRHTGPLRNFEKPLFGGLLLVAIASFAFNQSVASQQNAVAPAGTDIAPRGEREVKDITYGDWKKLCFKPGGAKKLCRTSITGTFATGQLAVRVDIIEREGDGARRIQVFSPVGMYLQNPIKLTIDHGRPYRVPYTWCLTNACIAATVANPLLINEMYAGRMLRLEFVNSNLLSLTTSLPLREFAIVHKNAPAQTFEQDIDE